MAVANTAPVQVIPQVDLPAKSKKFLPIESNGGSYLDDFNSLTDSLAPYVKAASTIGGILGTEFVINHARGFVPRGENGAVDPEMGFGFGGGDL